MARLLQAQATKATTKLVDALRLIAATITTSNLEIGRILNKAAADPNVVIANTLDNDKLDDTDKGIASALGTLAQRAGLDKQRVSEWRDNARVHDLGIAADLDMTRAPTTVGKNLPNGATDAAITDALTKAFDAADNKADKAAAKAKGKANKAAARAKANKVTRRMVSDAAGVAPRPSGTNTNNNVVVSIDNHVALAGALAQVRKAIDALTVDGHKGNVLVGNDRKVARDMVAILTTALDTKVVALVVNN